MAKRKQNSEDAIIVDGKFLAQKITGVQRAYFLAFYSL